MRERYLFIDANNLLHRSFHAMRELRRMDGERTGALHGFLKSLRWTRDQTDVRPRNVILFWDGGHADTRLQLFPDYKINRKKKKNEKEIEELNSLFRQKQAIKEICTHTGVRQIEVDGAEADDLISIFAHTARDEDGHVVVYTSDQDFHQIISPGIKILDPKKDLIGGHELEKIWGTTNVHRFAQLKAIIGDPSDSIPGIPRIGKKTAPKLLPYLEIPDLEDPFPRTDETPTEKDAKLVARFEEHRDLVTRNYRLICLPKTWTESFYTKQQHESALLQWLKPTTKNLPAFRDLLLQEELNDVAENLHRW